MRGMHHQAEMMRGGDRVVPRGCCRVSWHSPGGFSHAGLQFLMGKGLRAGQQRLVPQAGQVAGDGGGQTRLCSRGETRDLRGLRRRWAAPERERLGGAGGRVAAGISSPPGAPSPKLPGGGETARPTAWASRRRAQERLSRGSCRAGPGRAKPRAGSFRREPRRPPCRAVPYRAVPSRAAAAGRGGDARSRHFPARRGF